MSEIYLLKIRERAMLRTCDSEYAHNCDTAKVENLPVWGALKDVVDWREERGDDHDDDSYIVNPEQ